MNISTVSPHSNAIFAQKPQEKKEDYGVIFKNVIKNISSLSTTINTSISKNIQQEFITTPQITKHVWVKPSFFSIIKKSLKEIPRLEKPLSATTFWMHQVNQRLIKQKIHDTLDQLKESISQKDFPLVDETLLFLKTLISLSDPSDNDQDNILINYAEAINNNLSQIPAAYLEKLIYFLKGLLFSRATKQSFTYSTKNDDTLTKIVKNYQKALKNSLFLYELEAMNVFLEGAKDQKVTPELKDLAHLLFTIIWPMLGNITLIGASCRHLMDKMSTKAMECLAERKFKQFITIEMCHHIAIHSNTLDAQTLNALTLKITNLFKNSDKTSSLGCLRTLHTIALHSNSQEAKEIIFKSLRINTLNPTFIVKDIIWHSKINTVYEALLRENPLFFSTISKKSSLKEISDKALTDSIKKLIKSYMEEDEELYSKHFCHYLLAVKEGIFVTSTACPIDNLYMPPTLPKNVDEGSMSVFDTALDVLRDHPPQEKFIEFNNLISELLSDIEQLIKDHSSKRYDLLKKMAELKNLTKKTNFLPEIQKKLEIQYKTLSEERLKEEKAQQQRVNHQIEQNFKEIGNNISKALNLFFKNEPLILNNTDYINQIKAYNSLSIRQFFNLQEIITQEIENQKILYATEEFPLEDLSKKIEQKLNNLILSTFLDTELSLKESTFNENLSHLKDKLFKNLQTLQQNHSELTFNNSETFLSDIDSFINSLDEIKQILNPLEDLKSSFINLMHTHSSLVSFANLNKLDNKLNYLSYKSNIVYHSFKKDAQNHKVSSLFKLITELVDTHIITEEFLNIPKKLLKEIRLIDLQKYQELIELSREKLFDDNKIMITTCLNNPSALDVNKIKALLRTIELFQRISLFQWKGIKEPNILEEIDPLIEEKERGRLKHELKTSQTALNNYLAAMSLELSRRILNEVENPFDHVENALKTIDTRYVIVDEELKKQFNAIYLTATNEQTHLKEKLSLQKKLDPLIEVYENATNEIDNLSDNLTNLTAIDDFLNWKGVLNKEFSLKGLQKHYMKNLTESAKKWRHLRLSDNLNLAACEMIQYSKAAIQLNYEKTFTHTLCMAVNELNRKTQKKLANKLRATGTERRVVELIINNVPLLNWGT